MRAFLLPPSFSSMASLSHRKNRSMGGGAYPLTIMTTGAHSTSVQFRCRRRFLLGHAQWRPPGALRSRGLRVGTSAPGRGAGNVTGGRGRIRSPRSSRYRSVGFRPVASADRRSLAGSSGLEFGTSRRPPWLGAGIFLCVPLMRAPRDGVSIGPRPSAAST